MATLEHRQTGRPFVPAARVVVGRSPTAGLVLDDRGVSGEHTALFWTGEAWHVRDLGSRNGTWVGDRRVQIGHEEALKVGDELRFGVDSQRWVVLDLGPPDEEAQPQPLPPTREVAPTRALADVGLRLRVSRDEEYIEIDVVGSSDPVRLAPRAFHDLVLVLARARLAQRGRGSAAEEGWVYFDRLPRMLGRSRQRVNVDVFRARQQLAELGIADAVDLFERRPTTRQIRLGVADVAVSAL